FRQATFDWRSLLDFLPPGAPEASARLGWVSQASSSSWTITGSSAAGLHAGWKIKLMPVPGQSFSSTTGDYPPEGVDAIEVRDASGVLVANISSLYQDAGILFTTLDQDWFTGHD